MSQISTSLWDRLTQVCEGDVSVGIVIGMHPAHIYVYLEKELDKQHVPETWAGCDVSVKVVGKFHPAEGC